MENLNAPHTDPAREVTHYTRSRSEDEALGIKAASAAADGMALTEERLKEEVLHFPTNCPDCNAPAETNMKVTRKCPTCLDSSVCAGGGGGSWDQGPPAAEPLHQQQPPRPRERRR